MTNDDTLKSYEQLVEELETAKINLAFYHMQQADIQKAEEEIASKQEINGLQAKKTEDIAFLRNTMQNKSRKRRANNFLNLARRVAIIICVLITAITVTTTTAYAIVPSFRASVQHFLIDYTYVYAEVGVKNLEDIQLPEGWESEYFLSYVPDGFKVFDVYSGIGTYSSVNYMHEDGKSFVRFLDMPKGSRTRLDVENAKVTYAPVHDREAMVIEKDGTVTIAWQEFKSIFVIKYDGDRQTALNIAKNVVRVK